MQGLWNPIRQEDWAVTALEHIEKHEPFLISGTGDSVQNHLIAAFSGFTERPAVVITANEMKAKEVYGELKFYFSRLAGTSLRKIHYFTVLMSVA